MCVLVLFGFGSAPPHLDRLFASQPVLVLLVAEDQEGPAVLVEGQATDGRHGCGAPVLRGSARLGQIT